LIEYAHMAGFVAVAGGSFHAERGQQHQHHLFANRVSDGCCSIAELVAESLCFVARVSFARTPL
jgi:hypothetical protein